MTPAESGSEPSVMTLPSSSSSSPSRPAVPVRKPRRSATAAGPELAADPARTPPTPDSWRAAATAVLVDQGIDHVRVDLLATQPGVTRGSF